MNKAKLLYEAKAYIRIVLSDCQTQVDHLKGRDDVNWDCYNKSNWLNLVGRLKDALKIINAHEKELKKLMYAFEKYKKDNQ